MKKILLLMMCCPMILSAQNGVMVSNLDVKPGTVTFNVSWKKTGMPTLWSDSVWVFVDYNKNGVMTRLPVTSATATAGTVTKVQGNDKGVWVIGNARSAGSFSATVQLLTDITDVAGACAYASNYPPVGEYVDATQIKFTGTPMYNLTLISRENETDTIYRVSGAICDMPEKYTLLSFTDATGAPGIISVTTDAPPYAATAQTWTLCDRTWSDVINVAPPNCNLVESASTVNGLREVVLKNNNYYYTWQCVVNSQHLLCPYPWRVPKYADAEKHRGCSTKSAVAAALHTIGRLIPPDVLNYPNSTYAMCIDYSPDWYYSTVDTGSLWPASGWKDVHLLPVRCIK